MNRIINTLRKEEVETSGEDKYPWLDNSDERKHMADREILDKNINLESFMFNQKGETKVEKPHI